MTQPCFLTTMPQVQNRTGYPAMAIPNYKVTLKSFD